MVMTLQRSFSLCSGKLCIRKVKCRGDCSAFCRNLRLFLSSGLRVWKKDERISDALLAAHVHSPRAQMLPRGQAERSAGGRGRLRVVCRLTSNRPAVCESILPTFISRKEQLIFWKYQIFPLVTLLENKIRILFLSPTSSVVDLPEISGYLYVSVSVYTCTYTCTYSYTCTCLPAIISGTLLEKSFCRWN